MHVFHYLRSIAVATIGLPMLASAATVYQAGPDLKTFEAANSGAVAAQNGAWQYGTAPAAAGIPDSANFAQFSKAEHSDTIVLPGIGSGDLQGWQRAPTGDLVPAVAVNTTAGPITSSCCGTYDVNEIWMHSGQTGSGRDYAVVRWVAPAAGTIDYSGTFIAEGGLNNNNPVSVLLDGIVLKSGTAAGSDASTGTVLSDTAITVAANDVLDFTVTNYNSTGFFGTVSFTAATPEPASLGLIGLGAMGLLARRRKA